MAPRHKVDPNKFMGVGALVDWAAVAKTQTGRQVTPPDEIARWRKLNGTVSVQLRWAFDAGLGYPRTPFTVWIRTPTGSSARSDGPGSRLHRRHAGWRLDSAYAEVVLVIGDGPGGSRRRSTGCRSPHGIGDGTRRRGSNGGDGSRHPRSAWSWCRRDTGRLVRGRTSELADDPSWRPIEMVGIPGDGRTANNTDLTGRPRHGGRAHGPGRASSTGSGAVLRSTAGSTSGARRTGTAWTLADPAASSSCSRARCWTTSSRWSTPATRPSRPPSSSRASRHRVRPHRRHASSTPSRCSCTARSPTRWTAW